MPASYLKATLEESPRYDGALTTTPYRLASESHYFPIKGFKPSIGPEYLDRSDELRGTNADPADLRVSFDAGGSLTENCYLNGLTWLLELAGFEGTHTAGDGIITDPDATVIPAGAEKWVFDKRAGAQAKSAQLDAAFGDANDGDGVLLRGQGFGASGLELNAAGELTAEFTGLLWKRVTAPSFDTPAYDSAAIPPILMSNISLDWLANSAKASDFSVSIENPLEKAPDLSLDPQPESPALLEHGTDQRVRLTGSIAKRILSDEDLDALIAGTTFAAVAKWKSRKVIGATAYFYSLWIEMPACQYNGDDIEDLGNKRRHPASFPFKATLDEATGRDARITVVNAVESIETLA